MSDIFDLFVYLLQILFMNKIDLFQEKILHSGRHLRLYVPQFKGQSRWPHPNIHTTRAPHAIGKTYVTRLIMLLQAIGVWHEMAFNVVIDKITIYRLEIGWSHFDKMVYYHEM